MTVPESAARCQRAALAARRSARRGRVRRSTVGASSGARSVPHRNGPCGRSPVAVTRWLPAVRSPISAMRTASGTVSVTVPGSPVSPPGTTRVTTIEPSGPLGDGGGSHRRPAVGQTKPAERWGSDSVSRETSAVRPGRRAEPPTGPAPTAGARRERGALARIVVMCGPAGANGSASVRRLEALGCGWTCWPESDPLAAGSGPGPARPSRRRATPG